LKLFKREVEFSNIFDMFLNLLLQD